MTGNQLN